ncbi:hypothetical protein CRG98_050359 [Punica granatum]|uniref:Uncharacterized protein n=1 Tax=Punica granatum TaxID=22663 RepID=A0A2I0GDA8_PUNGR|nr:hypothetical protein CRG98_050359 [Punica granatum]
MVKKKSENVPKDINHLHQHPHQKHGRSRPCGGMAQSSCCCPCLGDREVPVRVVLSGDSVLPIGRGPEENLPIILPLKLKNEDYEFPTCRGENEIDYVQVP